MNIQRECQKQRGNDSFLRILPSQCVNMAANELSLFQPIMPFPLMTLLNTGLCQPSFPYFCKERLFGCTKKILGSEAKQGEEKACTLHNTIFLESMNVCIQSQQSFTNSQKACSLDLKNTLYTTHCVKDHTSRLFRTL